MVMHFKAEYITFDYTGYGESRKAHVGEEIICKDLEIVLAWSKRSLENIILWGFSLGTYPVIYNAARHKVKAIILQCPIGSLACMFYD
jgi:pimeloyl-ACP methyl ester carboxylesterase